VLLMCYANRLLWLHRLALKLKANIIRSDKTNLFFHNNKTITVHAHIKANPCLCVDCCGSRPKTYRNCMELIDKNIAEKMAKDNGLTIAKLGLRFDKTVVQLLSSLRNAVSKHIPPSTVVLLTITAPIKLPSKTEFELCQQIETALTLAMRHQSHESIVFQNKVSIRLIDVPVGQAEKFVGFVHNPDRDPKQLLDLASTWLLKN
jgi:hypothetical protein